LRKKTAFSNKVGAAGTQSCAVIYIRILTVCGFIEFGDELKIAQRPPLAQILSCCDIFSSPFQLLLQLAGFLCIFDVTGKRKKVFFFCSATLILGAVTKRANKKRVAQVT
jgi:hypothetical protein